MKTANEKTLIKLFKAPLASLSVLSEKLKNVDSLSISRMAESDAERLILIAEYLSARYNGRDHAEARKQTSRKLIRVRRAMGYTYPKSGLPEISY